MITKIIFYNILTYYINFRSNKPNQVSLQDKQITITENTTTIITPDNGYDGLEQVEITTDVSTASTNVMPLVYATINENGRYSYTPSEGYDGIANVTVNVNVPQPVIEDNVEFTTTSNGNYTIVPSIGRAGMSSVDLTVNVPNSTQTKTITTNGTFTPDSGYIGFSNVSVNVPTTANLQSVIANVNGNGTQVVTPSSGYDGLSQITINTNVDKRSAVRYIGFNLNSATGSYVDLLSDIFTRNNTENSINVTIPADRTLIRLSISNTSYQVFIKKNTSSNDNTHVVYSGNYYYILNYGGNGNAIYLNKSLYGEDDNYLVLTTEFNVVNDLYLQSLVLEKGYFVLPNIQYNDYQ